MDNFEKFLSLGKSCGFEGKELIQFAESKCKEAEERDLRQQEREEKRLAQSMPHMPELM